MNIQHVLNNYGTLSMTCPNCDRQESIQVPVNLKKLNCSNCGDTLDPVQWKGSNPVSHVLMRRLISICYKHPAFARKVIEHYKRDYDHAKSNEWGIDKSLLIIHAANGGFTNIAPSSRSFASRPSLALAILGLTNN